MQLTLFPPCKKQTNSKSRQDATLDGAETASGTVETDKEDSTEAPTTDQESDDDDAAPQDLDQIKDIICYGIGSIESSKNSQFQLALGLCLKDVLKVCDAIHNMQVGCVIFCSLTSIPWSIP